MNKPHIVIVGGGFGGIAAAEKLAKTCRVTLVDRNAYTTFQPLLYQVATGGLNPGDITYSLRSFVARHRHGMRFRRACVTGIDTQNRIVTTDVGEPLTYDYLILAVGVGANFFGIPGAEEYAHSIYTRAEALAVRDEIFGKVEALTVAEPSKRLSVVVVGGGATGVEMAGALAEMKQQGVPIAYPELNPDRLGVILVEMGPVLLAPFDEKLQRYTLDQVRKRGVDVRLNTAIKEVREDSVVLGDGAEEQADIVVWGAGIGGHDVVATWGFEQGRGGRIVVGDDLRVPGQDRVFAIGDCAITPDNPLPQVAQPAIQMGHRAAENILALEDGGAAAPFAYADRGSMATIGRSAAVVELPRGPRLKGLPAWLAWVVLHLSYLLGGRNRIASMVNLGFRYLMYPRSANSIVGDIGRVESRAIASDLEAQDR